jgi:hypothetical protein
MHITHWIPTSGAYPPWSVFESYANLELPEGATRTFRRTTPGNVNVIWNDFIKKFLQSDSDWVFSTHHDVNYVPGTLKRLLSWDKPLVNALCFMRHSPVLPMVWKDFDGVEGHYAMRVNDTREWFYEHREFIKFGPQVMEPRPDNALVEAGFTSTGCTLIHRSVLEKMRDEVCGEKWFELDNEIAGGGEDRRFFEYARRVGFDCLIDRSCIVAHVIGDIPTGVADFIAWDAISEFHNTGEPNIVSYRDKS